MPRYESPLLTRKEAWRYLGISESQLQRLVAQHEIKTVRMGGVLRFLKSDLDDYIDRCNGVGFLCSIFG